MDLRYTELQTDIRELKAALTAAREKVDEYDETIQWLVDMVWELQNRLEEAERDRETLRRLHIDAADCAIRAEATVTEMAETIQTMQADYDRLFQSDLLKETLLQRFAEFREVAKRIAEIDPTTGKE